MADNISTQDILRLFGPGSRTRPTEVPANRNDLTYELQKYLHVLGPTPKRCLEILADLGLSDPEIARYFKVPNRIVTGLRKVWRIDGDT